MKHGSLKRSDKQTVYARSDRLDCGPKMHTERVQRRTIFQALDSDCSITVRVATNATDTVDGVRSIILKAKLDNGSQMITLQPNEHRLRVLRTIKSTPAAISMFTDVSLNMMHRRFGHANKSVLIKIQNLNAVQ